MKMSCILFFAITLTVSSVFNSNVSVAQWYGSGRIDSLIRNGDSQIVNGQILADSMVGNAKNLSDSILDGLRALNLHAFTNRQSKQYFSKDGQRYFIDIVPPPFKGKEVDHSDVWLLNEEVAQAWH